MTSSPSTWMPIYWGDYLKHTMHLSTEEHGAYLLLICHYWQNGGKIKNDEKIIKNVCKISSKKLQNVLAFFEEKDGFLTHSRIDNELASAVENKEKQRNRTKAATEARLLKEQRNVDVTSDVTLSPSPSPSPSSNGIDKSIPKRVSVDYEFFKRTWKEYLPSLPQVERLTDARKVALRSRWDDFEHDEQAWFKLLKKIQGSDWLMGRNDKGFTATFDWVLKPANMTKILEGNYDNRGNTNAKSIRADFGKQDYYAGSEGFDVV